MKWSDGHPLTAEDFTYAYEVQTNPDLKAQPKWIRLSGDPIVKVVKIDDYTVEYRYAGPYYFFPKNLAYSCTNKDMQYRPAHYLKQFDANHNPDAQKNAEAAGYETWQQHYMTMEDARDNPDFPVTAAWVWTNTRADDPIRLSRNPYFPMVDQEGNQLPYIDTLRFSSAAGGEVLNLRAAQGDIDLQGRHISFNNFSVLKEGEERGNYEVRMVPDLEGSDVMLIFNLTYRGPEGELIGNKDWRIAMAYAIDRDSINEITMGGQGTVRNALPSAGSPLYPGPDYETKHATYEPDTSNAMLDGVMGPKDGDGFRTLPNGDRFEFIISTMDAFGGFVDGAEQMCEDFRDVGVRCRPEVLERSLLGTRDTGNELMARIHNADSDGDILFTGAGKQLPMGGQFGWAPDWGRYHASLGESGSAPPSEIQHLIDQFIAASGLPESEQEAIVKEIFRYNVDNAVRLGTVGASGLVSGIVIISNDLANVPEWWAQRNAMNMPMSVFPEQLWFASAERRGD
jgi:peptide/nickel transport system substrate-binding protein